MSERRTLDALLVKADRDRNRSDAVTARVLEHGERRRGR